MDQAMTFVISGGAVSPDHIDFNGEAANPIPMNR